MFQRSYLFLIPILFILEFSKDGLAEEHCFLANNATGGRWHLLWQDNFESSASLNEHWIVDNEIDKCKFLYGFTVSCNRAPNAWIDRDKNVLVLSVKNEKYLDSQFSGAMLTSKRNFTHGRWEIRSTLPIGQQLSAQFITKHKHEQYWHQMGQFNLMSTPRGSIVSNESISMVYYGNSRATDDVTMQVHPIPNAQQLFHLYGMEWDEKGVTFFVDNQYGEKIFLQERKEVAPEQQIRLLIRVEHPIVDQFTQQNFDSMKDILQKFGPTMLNSNLIPNTANQFGGYLGSGSFVPNWQCPVLIVDYVRIYGLVRDEDVRLKNLTECQQIKNNVTLLEVNEICQKAFKTKTVDQPTLNWASKIGQNWEFIIIGVLFTLFLIFIPWFCMKSVKFIKIIQEPNNTAVNDDFNLEEIEMLQQFGNPEEPIKYLDLQDAEITETKPNKRHSYLDLQDGENKYEQIFPDSENKNEDTKYLELQDGENQNTKDAKLEEPNYIELYDAQLSDK